MNRLKIFIENSLEVIISQIFILENLFLFLSKICGEKNHQILDCDNLFWSNRFSKKF